MNKENFDKVELDLTNWLKMDVWLAGDVEGRKFKRKIKLLYMMLSGAFLLDIWLVHYGISRKEINFAFIYSALLFLFMTVSFFQKEINQTKNMIRSNRKIVFYFTNNLNCTELPFYPEINRGGNMYTIVNLVDGYIACETADLEYINIFTKYYTDSPIFWVKYQDLLKLYGKV